jgi:DNA-binding CsgD family transcriptional regulator
MAPMTLIDLKRPRGRPGSGTRLTPAERETLRYLRLRMTNAEIADARGISVNTVRTQVSSMIGKLSLKNRKALAAWEDPMEKNETPLRCTFCRRTSDTVTYMVAGRDGYICGDCVDKCNDVIAKAKAAEAK